METMGKLKERILAAQGKLQSDLIIEDVSYLDVFSCQWKKGNVAVFNGAIVGVEPGLKAKRTISGRNKYLVPGFIDAHVHLESSMMAPQSFEKAVLSKGTTTAFCDPHELANVTGPKGLQYFLDAANKMQMDLWVMMSSCVPATHLETNGGGAIEADTLLNLAQQPRAYGLAEMMNFPGVLFTDPAILTKLEKFTGRPLDGHCPLLKGAELSAYAAAGISSCHESSTLSEAEEKLTKGISVWVREGSVAKDLDTLFPLINLATSTSVGFCTDDRNPLDIHEEGHIDYLIRHAIQKGIAPEIVYRCASWSVARHYGLDKNNLYGKEYLRVGAIAPGYQADLVLLSDKSQCAIETVFKKGKEISELDFKSIPTPEEMLSTVKASAPNAEDLIAPDGQVHVIGAEHGKIVTQKLVMNSNAPGVAKLSVLERYGKGGKPANAYVFGFGEKLNGAIASSVGHDSHNLIVVGSNYKDMAVAIQCLIKTQGGFCVVKDSAPLAVFELPFGGLMSEKDTATIKQSLGKLKAASKQIGCQLPEPFLQLAFLSLPVIPSLKLTDKGLVDVESFNFISVRAA